MKKLLCIALILLLLLSLSACDNGNKTTGVIEEKTAIDDVATDTSTSSWIEMPSYFSYEDYEKDLSKFLKIPGFVTYETIKEYGEFVSLVFLDSLMCEDAAYVYDLVGSDGFQFSLYIFPEDRKFENSSNTAVLMEVQTESNLGLNDDKSGVYYANDIEYLYWNGKVTRISWSTSSRFISIIASTETYFPSFNTRNSSLINSLLNTETAPAAIAEFNRKVSD